MTIGKSTHAKVIVVLACLAGGCHPPASKLSEANLNDATKVKVAAGSYWEHMPENVPPSGYQKVALVEFAIEYVTEKIESLADNQPRVVIHEFIPIGFVASIAGTGRIRIEIDETYRKELPDEMYQYFVKRLETEGFKLIPQETIRSAKAFKNLKLGEPGHTDLAHAFNLAGTDVGVPRLLVIEPATGTDFVLGTNDGRTVEQVEKDLIEEVGADIALRVRFRISAYRQFASIEKWSILRVTKGDTSGFHFAGKSLLSDEKVVAKEGFLPVAGIIKTIDTDQYRQAIKTLYPAFLDMAAHTLAAKSETVEIAEVE